MVMLIIKHRNLNLIAHDIYFSYKMHISLIEESNIFKFDQIYSQKY